MDATTAQLLDYYTEHLGELVADGRISATESATALFHAESIAIGADPFGVIVAEAEQITRDA
ncbi:hypothetical protein SAMN05443665_1015142 [Actinomadura meyerae]|uniref:Uncharacterized protein n=1 Tax=Actinomadura meyerae TaxID=240840 RepID=A0A239JRC4_9ACTN|nr:hypothetical protein [Actinomadura meyerae]SNT08387.1 hypothetical protein SAMN05443665_1015142 [Actinomadura meyerae]